MACHALEPARPHHSTQHVSTLRSTRTKHPAPQHPAPSTSAKHVYTNVATTGAWSLVPTSARTGHAVARSAISRVAST